MSLFLTELKEISPLANRGHRMSDFCNPFRIAFALGRRFSAAMCSSNAVFSSSTCISCQLNLLSFCLFLRVLGAENFKWIIWKYIRWHVVVICVEYRDNTTPSIHVGSTFGSWDRTSLLHSPIDLPHSILTSNSRAFGGGGGGTFSVSPCMICYHQYEEGAGGKDLHGACLNSRGRLSWGGYGHLTH